MNAEIHSFSAHKHTNAHMHTDTPDRPNVVRLCVCVCARQYTSEIVYVCASTKPNTK